METKQDPRLSDIFGVNLPQLKAKEKMMNKKEIHTDSLLFPSFIGRKVKTVFTGAQQETYSPVM